MFCKIDILILVAVMLLSMNARAQETTGYIPDVTTQGAQVTTQGAQVTTIWDVTTPDQTTTPEAVTTTTTKIITTATPKTSVMQKIIPPLLNIT